MHRRLRTVIVGLCAGLLAGCGAASSPTSGPATSRSTERAWPGPVATVPVGVGPVGLAVSATGQVWVAAAQASTVDQVGATAVDRTVASIDTPLRLVAGGDSIWATAFGAGQLVRISATTGRVTARVPVGRGAEGVATGLGAVWVVAQDDGQLVKVDPRTATVVRRADIGAGARLVTTGLGAVWVSHFQSGQLIKVDPSRLTLTRSAPLCHGPQGVRTTTDAVWVTCTTDDVAIRVDPATLIETTRVRLPDAPDGLVGGPDGSLYVVCQAGPTVVQLDPGSGTVVRTRSLGGAAQLYDQANLDIATTSDSVWVSSYSEDRVYRIPI